jgi:hypothetical protein
MDRNRVAYPTWTELTGGSWQVVRIPFVDVHPNPYFQPPDAKTGTPIDVSGELLRLAEREFDVFLTVDGNLQHEQNLRSVDIAVISVADQKQTRRQRRQQPQRQADLPPASRNGIQERVQQEAPQDPLRDG